MPVNGDHQRESYRGLGRHAEALPLEENSDDFVFDNQMLAQIHWLGCTIAEVTCPTKYFAEASSINLRRSITYGFGCLHTAATYRLARQGWLRVPRFERLPPALPAGGRAEDASAGAVEPVLTAADAGP